LQTLIVGIITRRRATIDATARRARGYGGEKTTCGTCATRAIDMADDERATVEDSIANEEEDENENDDENDE